MYMKSKFECSYIKLLQHGWAHSLSASAALPLRRPHWVLHRDQTGKLRIFTSWPFTERVADPCSQPSLENRMGWMSKGSPLVPPMRGRSSVFHLLPRGKPVCLGSSWEWLSLPCQRSAEVATSRSLRSYSSLHLGTWDTVEEIYWLNATLRKFPELHG